jgi:DNA helicase-2/ATP-dependent DNA helicase PcrA
MDADGRMNVQAVQRPGAAPRIVACPDAETYERTLRESVRKAAGFDGLTAVIASDPRHARHLAAALADEQVTLMEGDAQLPATGVVVLPLDLAKGLEFDQVIIADASAAAFGATTIARHRLYVAISRATQQVTILSPGPITPLLQSAE